jgi:hypothetical protein
MRAIKNIKMDRPKRTNIEMANLRSINGPNLIEPSFLPATINLKGRGSNILYLDYLAPLVKCQIAFLFFK